MLVLNGDGTGGMLAIGLGWLRMVFTLGYYMGVILLIHNGCTLIGMEANGQRWGAGSGH